jgi:hypothetical protein
VSPRAINAGRFRLRVGVDVGAVAAGFEQRETYRVLAGQECAAGEAAAIAGDPITLAVALDVEVIGRADKFRDKSGHCDYGVCFMTPNKSYCPRKPSSSILAGSYKNIIEDNAACEVSSSETLGRFRDEAGFRCDRNSTRSSESRSSMATPPRAKLSREEPDAGNLHVRVCVQRRLACSAGDKPAGVEVRAP